MKQTMKGETGKRWAALILFLWVLALALLFAIIYRNQKATEIKNYELVNRQAIRQIDTVMKQLDNLSDYIKSDEQLEILLTQRTLDPSAIWTNQIAEHLNSRKNSAAGVDGILLIMENGNDFVNVGTMLSPDAVRSSRWYQDYCGMETTRYYSPLTDQFGSTNGEWKNYILAAYPYKTESVSGHMIFLYRFSAFKTALEEYESEGIPVCLCGRNDQILYAADGEDRWEEKANFNGVLDELRETYHSVKDTVKSTCIGDCTPLGGWKIVADLPAGHILKSMVPTFLVSALLFSVIYAGVWMLAFSRQKIVRTEYAFLSAQINPHFIYKALNTIMFLCKRGKNDQAVEATRALEDILKDKLRVDEVMIYDTLQRELEVIRQYLTIQKTYYNFPIVLQENVEEGLLDAMIPKNILHPLVENALYHGILLNMDEDGNMKGGTIQITARREKDEIVLEVADDGVGMSQEQVKQVFYSRKKKKERGLHIGIENVKDRLKYLRGLKHKLEVFSQPGKGTRVTLRIRVRRGG